MKLESEQVIEVLPWLTSGREAKDEITPFKGVGIATEDLGAAILALETVGTT